MFTNGSEVAIGVFLAQRDYFQVDHHIAYYIKTMSKSERIYSVTRRKFLTLIIAIKCFRLFFFSTYLLIKPLACPLSGSIK